MTVTDANISSNTAQKSGSAVHHSSTNTLKLLYNVTCVNPQTPHDSMIVAYGLTEWTCRLGQWAPLTGTIAATDFTGCPLLCPADLLRGGPWDACGRGLDGW